MNNIKSMKRKNLSTLIIIYILLFICVFFYLFPIYTAVNTSLKSNKELSQGPTKLIQDPVFTNYSKAFNTIKRQLWNSLVITVFATTFSAILGAFSGYGFSRLKFKGSSILFLLVVIGFYIAPQSILIPLVKYMGSIGLHNSYLGLILTHTAYGLPITTLLFRNYFITLPEELFESACIDGCGTFTAFYKIALPLSLPGFAVVAIFQFTNIWNEFLYGLVLTQGVNSQPVTVAVANLKGTTVASWNIQMAGVLISILPVLLIYIFFLKLIIKGLLMGSVKG